MSSVFPDNAPLKKSVIQQIQENLARQRKGPTTNTQGKNYRNITTVGTGQILCTTVPQQVGVVSRIRLSMKLTNLSNSVEVWWSTVAGLVPGDGGNGDFIPAVRGSWVKIPTPSVVWVAVASGTARISWAESYDDDDEDYIPL